MIHRLFLMLAMMTGSAWANPQATTIDLDSLTAQAQQVIVGSVLTTRNSVDADGLWTVATIGVSETLRGESEMIVDVRIPGGKVQNMEMQVRGAPTLIPGDNVLLFLNGDRVVDFGQGAFIVADKRAWRTLKDWVFMHPNRLDARSPDEIYYVSLDMQMVRQQVRRAN